MGKACVLAYSGGLDTSVAIGWLRDKFGFDVIALAVDVGQGVDHDFLIERATACGAAETMIVDAREEFARDFVLPALRANALYMGKYPLVSALSRPLIVRHLVRAARELGATAVAHGCTGKGNDQVRFEVSSAALAPDIEVIAPVRDAGLTRDAAIAYAEERGIPVPVTKSSPYSIDENLWGRTIECGAIEDPWAAPPEDAYAWTRSLSEAPSDPETIVVGFDAGAPSSIDGATTGLVDLIGDVSKRAGAHGIGRVDMIEDRLVGIKSREIYEVPGALTLIGAHCDLEDLTLERALGAYKRRIEPTYAELVYNGLWYSPLRRALDAFIASSQSPVTGDVRVRLHKGSAVVEGRRSPNALYSHSLATYESGDLFDHDAAAGFVRLWGLPTKVWADKQQPEEFR
ncbi:MAG: argininosuccinate synthase [Actinobacteria bacterium]|nr:MAG: argininosuccinate synthase [Actinomycetota bacterium]